VELLNGDYDNYYDRDETSLKAFRLISAGNAEEARQFAESEEYRNMLKRLTESDRDYEMSWMMSCAVHYAAALQAGVSSYTCLSLLRTLLQKRSSLSKASDYRNAMKLEFISFADLAAKAKRKAYSSTVTNAMRYIDDRLLTDIRLQEIADYCGYSPTTITHAFRKETGLSVREYIKIQKIKKACRLLKETGMKSSEAANYLGYASHSHFCRQFKEVTGMTPHQYRDHCPF